MDKKLIERIKYEGCAEMRSEFSPSVESFIDAYVDRLIARIDAERGKEAVAWALFSENGNIRIWTSAPEEVRRLAEDQGMTLSPLFLSPTIPEGMALVPIEPTEEMLKAADDGDREYTMRNFGADMPTVPQGAYDHYCAMLAAAPHPPAPCQCAEIEVVAYLYSNEYGTLRVDQSAKPATSSFPAVRQSDAAAIIAELRAEIERLTNAVADLRRKINLGISSRDTEISERDATIAQQAALIEQCEDALKTEHGVMDALEAIAAHKKGGA